MLDIHYPNYHHPHATIINCLHAFFSEYIKETGEVFYGELDEGLTSLLNLKRFWPKLSINNEYDESYFIFGYWGKGLLDPAEEEIPSNGVAEFKKGEKYLAYITSTDWGWWEETPYDFPAVFYSPIEIHAWIAWALTKNVQFCHQHQEKLIELIECHINIQQGLVLLQKKLNGDEPWDFGPARMHEPKMILWHERTKNKEMNDWIRQWID